MSEINTANWGLFKIEDLFEKQVTNTLKYKATNLEKTPTAQADLPALTAGVENQGLSVYVPRQGATILKDCISVSANGANSGAMFYQPNEFTVLQDSYAIKCKDKRGQNKFASLYMIGVLSKIIKVNYDWSKKATWNRIKETVVILPIITKEIPNIDKIEQMFSGGGIDMSKIDTSTWKAFKVGELFTCETTKGIANKNDLIEGDIPYITRSAEKNGLSGRCGNIDRKVKGNCITIGAEGFAAFYQENDFVAGNKVYALRHPLLNKTNALYFVAALNALSSRYSFQDARILDRIKEETILLPIKEIEEPDWNYMENYMKAIEVSVSDSIEKLASAKDIEKKKIGVREWGEFKVEELFDIHPTKTIKGKDGKTLSNKDLLDGGEYPVIANSSYNNGIVGFSSYSPTEAGKIITFSDTVDANTIFYQPIDFIGYSHVQGLYPIGKHKDRWSPNTLKYFATVFRATALNKGFNFGNKFRRDIASKLTIKLPITSTGEPDWAYMEEYMKNIEQKIEQSLTGLAG